MAEDAGNGWVPEFVLFGASLVEVFVFVVPDVDQLVADNVGKYTRQNLGR